MIILFVKEKQNDRKIFLNKIIENLKKLLILAKCLNKLFSFEIP